MRLVSFRSLEPIQESGGMSLSERLKSRRSPEPLPGLSRSRSFAGLLGGGQHRRTASATANFASLGSSDAGSVSSLGSSGSGGGDHHRVCNGSGGSSAASTLSRATSILGQSHSPNTTRRLLQGFSATWGGKPPPVPRPQRAATIFQSIEKGLKECIQLTQKDILNVKSSVDSLSVNSSQHLKTAERYLKRLEYQEAKLEELAEQYDVQQRMRDGVRTMAYAFVLNPGKERDSALHSVRSGFKECTDILCGIETELERMMGTLMFQLKGIQGFARLCVGDVFEITVKHGEQKWKTKGRIMKNEKQVWDNPRAIFKALMGEMLYIKAVEVRTLSKNVLLGHKYCETKDLFSAHSQMMTVNLNPSGSLKLHVVITWNPLHGCPEELSPRPLPPLLAALQSPMMKRRAPLPPTVALHEDLHSPSSALLANGTVCMPPLVPSSPSLSHSSQPHSPRLVRSEVFLPQESLSAALDFSPEDDTSSSSEGGSNSGRKVGLLKSDRRPNEYSLVDLIGDDDFRLQNRGYSNLTDDYAFHGKEPLADSFKNLHVNFEGVHDSQSLYGSRAGNGSSGYGSQSRNGSMLRSVHFDIEPKSGHSSTRSCRSKGSYKSPMLYDFMKDSNSCYQYKSSFKPMKPPNSSHFSNSDTEVQRGSFKSNKPQHVEERSQKDIRIQPSCAVVHLQPYNVDQKLESLLGRNNVQQRLVSYFEYR